MGKYPSLGTLFNRVFRNTLNANFDAVDTDINLAKAEVQAAKSEALAKVDEQKTRVDNLITEAPQPSEVVDARGGKAVLSDRLNDVDASLVSIVQEDSTYNAKQVRALSRLMTKLVNNDPIVGVCQGDSLTNGQDNESGDKRPYTADATYTVGGSTDTSIGSYTYPEVLQSSLNEKGTPTTIIKRGYNGDTAVLSYNRWTTNPNADFHIIQLGTNDTWLENDLVKDMDNYYKLVKRILDWGSAVIIFTPPKKAGYSHWQGTYGKVLKELGKRFSIPVIDTTLFFDGYYTNEIYQSDNVHFNGKGYYILGAKAAGILTGVATIADPFRLKTHRHLVIDPNYNHWATKGSISFGNDGASPFGSSTSGYGVNCIIGASSQASFGFYAEEDDLLLIPQFTAAEGSQCFIELNYRADAAFPMTALTTGGTDRTGLTKPANSIYYQVNQSQKVDHVNLDINNLDFNALRVTSRGYNSIQIRNNNASGTIWFYGFYVISMSEYLTNRLVNSRGNITTVGDPNTDIVNIVSKSNVFIKGLLAPESSQPRDIGAYWAKWRKGFFNGFISTGAYSTANRPAYDDYQPGAMIYDTTLNKPIWRNAANNGWVDANGNAV